MNINENENFIIDKSSVSMNLFNIKFYTILRLDTVFSKYEYKYSISEFKKLIGIKNYKDYKLISAKESVPRDNTFDFKFKYKG